MKTLTKCIILLSLLFLCSCDKDETFSPPEAGSKIMVAVKLPNTLEMLPLRVMYRSEFCNASKVNGSGILYNEPGFKIIKFDLNNKGRDYKLPVPVDGGGECQWKLSNITFSFKSALVKSAHTVPISEVVSFDSNPPQRISGTYQDVTGDLDLTGDYFPMVTTYHMNGYKKVESIIRSTPDKIYRVHNGGNVFFHPVFHSSKIINAIEPKEQKIGEYMLVIYPDGTTESSPYFPNYKKIKSLIGD